MVRLSGREAIPITDRLFRGRRQLAVVGTHTVHHGLIVGGDGNAALDEVLASVMHAPHTYTGEDVVEISCHGGRMAARTVLEALVQQGARLAGPGEFTRRAFLNGRIDLAQAEAVVDVVRARTSRALTVAMRQLSGGLSRQVQEIRGRFLDLVARMEATLDFPEEEIPQVSREVVRGEIEQTSSWLRRLLEGSRIGTALREGVSVAIVGKPNVGKSTLFNALLGADRAIVSPDPGTTRDVLEGWTEIEGIPVRLIDGAGIRSGTDGIEREGIRRARAVIDEASALLVMVDASSALTSEDEDVIVACRGKQVVVVLNKCDLPQAISRTDMRGHPSCGGRAILEVSSLTGAGLGELKSVAGGLLADGWRSCVDEEVLMCNMRHIEAVRGAVQALERARGALDDGYPEDLIVADLVEGLHRLGEVIGEDISDDILDRIFSEFCIGK